MPYQSIWNHRAEDIERVLHETKDEFPQAWQAAHNPQRGDKRQREEYCQRVCAKLRAIGIPAGMNGKRGNPNDLSEDIIALPNIDGAGRSHGGALDTSGRFPAIEIRDVIASAGPDREGNQGGRPYFGDVTQATLDKGETGCYVEPTLQGGSRPPVGGPVTPTDPPVTPPTGAQHVLAEVIAGIQADILDLQQRQANVLAGIGALATQIGNLEGKLLNTDGAFDHLTKRVFGVGTDDPSIAEETVALLLRPADQGGADLGCKVHRRLRG